MHERVQIYINFNVTRFHVDVFSDDMHGLKAKYIDWALDGTDIAGNVNPLQKQIT